MHQLRPPALPACLPARLPACPPALPALPARLQILESEGQRQSKINVAEAAKSEVILGSEASRQDQINRAQGEWASQAASQRARGPTRDAAEAGAAQLQSAWQHALPPPCCLLWLVLLQPRATTHALTHRAPPEHHRPLHTALFCLQVRPRPSLHGPRRRPRGCRCWRRPSRSGAATRRCP
jgi:hypothetical protein